MNLNNLDNQKLTCKFAIVICRILYILLFLLSLFMLVGKDDGVSAAIVFGGFAIIIVITTIFLKHYLKKLNYKIIIKYE